MARLKRFCSYKILERPYTRISKYKKKSFIKANPNKVIVRYDMGTVKKSFSCTLNLVSKEDLQIRHNAIESARQTSNRLLENELGRKGYHFKVKIYPFHILRENPLASGAGADRFSTGMKHSFGKPISSAARVKKGQTMFTISTNKQSLGTARKAMDKARHKLPCSCTIQVIEKKAT
ncbi:50S ribosomal protein L16 [Candidatus Woesearchaeota archaeon]|nr:50S ribosomal protein L16 [Candidatus Woesearchaeota archaeon]|tara:strand:- start:20183 stop:20713 length:531 start_codon:yes stop_codon:yes gene_type:complete